MKLVGLAGRLSEVEMTDDIATLREFIVSRQNIDTHYGDMALVNRKDNALAALERMEKERAEQEKLYNDAIEEGAMKIAEAEAERDSLRAKLEKARGVLLRTRELVSSCAMEGFNLVSSPIDELFANNGKITAALSELSADAPAQPPQLCPVHGKPFPCCVDFDPTAPAQPPQISDEVVERALREYHCQSAIFPLAEFRRMRAAIAAAREVERKG